MTSYKTGPVDRTKPLELDDGTPVKFMSYIDGLDDIKVVLPEGKSPRRDGKRKPGADDQWYYEGSSGRWVSGDENSHFVLRNVTPQIGHNGGPVLVGESTPAVVNPKELAGAKKPAVWSVMPRWVALAVGRVMSVGAAKYGAFNYRDSNIAASTYQDAIERHLALWFDGEDNDDETGVSHLASVVASCALLMDAQQTGRLHDDRQKTGNVRPYLDELTELLKTKPLPYPQY